MDGTIIEEHIYQDAGAKRQAMTVGELKAYIRAAGYIPVERDTVYNEIEVFA
jgi:aminodeoxyfutalosine synthase